MQTMVERKPPSRLSRSTLERHELRIGSIWVWHGARPRTGHLLRSRSDEVGLLTVAPVDHHAVSRPDTIVKDTRTVVEPEPGTEPDTPYP